MITHPVNAFKGLLAAVMLVYSLTPAHPADIYTWTNEKGETIFSDEPEPGARKVEPEEIQTVPPLPHYQGRRPFTEPSPRQDAGYIVQIGSPAQDATIFSNEGRLAVSIAVSPPLRASHRLQLLLDGQAVPGTGLSRSLTNIDRGTHQLQAIILDNNNRIIGESTAVTVHLKRHSVLFKRP